MNIVERARQTLERIPNAALATVSADGRPWNSPLYVAFDANLTFYWSSRKDAVHSGHIAINRNVFLVVFDSATSDGSGHAVYVRAIARELKDEASLTSALECLAKRKNEQPKAAAEFIGAQPWRLYEAVPDTVWTNVVEECDGHYYDKRLVVDLLSGTPRDLEK